MKKLMAIFLLLSLLLGCMTACAKQSASSDTGEGSRPAGDAADSGGKKTLTIGLQQHAQVEDYDTNYFTRYLEENTGIDLEFVYFSSDIDEAMTQLALMVSSNEKLPDILWSFMNMDKSVMYEYGEDGYFLDLRDYFDQYGHYFWETYDTLPETDQHNIFALGTDPNNNAFYGFPHYMAQDLDSFQWLASINTEWLDAVGCQAPANIDELYNVLKKFAAEDPNGNGIVDEIPMVGLAGKNSWRADISDYIVNAFVYCDPQYIFNATDGRLWTPFTTDEYRQAMIYLNQLCSEGLLSTINFTATAHSELIPIVTPSSGTALTGIFGGHPLLVCEEGNELLYEYTGLAPLQAATDLGGYTVIKPPYLIYTSFITADCENPELAFQLLDFMCSDDAARAMRHGEEGVDWLREEGESLFGEPSIIKIVNPGAFTAQGNQTWHNNGSTLQTHANYPAIFVDDGTYASKNSIIQKSQYDAMLSAPTPDEVVYDLVYTAEELEVVSEVKQLLQDYIAEARALFATGVLDPNNDADWQSYLNNLENQRLSEFLAISQTAYDRMNGV